MPHEKDVQERQYWWCPKWYWPFAVCSGIRTAHKWCYNFAWLKSTGYLFTTYYEACEDGTLYTWYTPFGGIGSSPAQRTFGETCFDSARSSAGRCDASNTGLEAQGLSVSDPLATNFSIDSRTIESTVFENGTFEYTAENGSSCQIGLWPWKRTLHRQEISASVDTRFASIQWYVAGQLLTGGAGTIQVVANCQWPFPLPKGRNHNQVVDIDYQVVTEHSRSTIHLFNNQYDGCYSFPIEMKAFDNGKFFDSYYTTWAFKGETCDFDPAQEAEYLKCIIHQELVFKNKAKFKVPDPGDPVIDIKPEIWNYVSQERKPLVEALISILKYSYGTDAASFLVASNQLEFELGLPGIVDRLVTYRGLKSGSGDCHCSSGKGEKVAALVTVVAIGICIGAIWLLRNAARKRQIG